MAISGLGRREGVPGQPCPVPFCENSHPSGVGPGQWTVQEGDWRTSRCHPSRLLFFLIFAKTYWHRQLLSLQCVGTWGCTLAPREASSSAASLAGPGEGEGGWVRAWFCWTWESGNKPCFSWTGSSRIAGHCGDMEGGVSIKTLVRLSRETEA